MIVNSKKMLIRAKKNKIAIPQFSANNLEWAKYILEECNKENSPVIISFSENNIEYIGGYKMASNLIRTLDQELNIKVPVVIHYDKGSSFANCKKAIDSGFTSVMIDGSKLSLDENIKLTKQVVEYADKYSVTVEAKIELSVNVDDIKRFVKETNIDSLVLSINSKTNIDFDLCQKISKSINIPLVLDEILGINVLSLKKIINTGMTKISFNTDLQIAWSNGLKKYLLVNGKETDPKNIIKSGEKDIKRVIKNKIDVLCSNF